MSSGSSPSGLFGSVRAILHTIGELLSNRLSLLSVEIQQEGQRLLKVLIWACFGVLLLVLGIVGVAVLMILLLWDSHRLLALGVVIVGLFGLGSAAVMWALSILRTPSGLLTTSLAELRQDIAALTSKH